jgi:hypothetical protein
MFIAFGEFEEALFGLLATHSLSPEPGDRRMNRGDSYLYGDQKLVSATSDNAVLVAEGTLGNESTVCTP